MQGVLAECLIGAHVATPKQIEIAPAKLAEAEEVLGRAEQKLKNLLGFELGARAALEERINKLKQQKRNLQLVAKYGALGRLSLEPLRWLNKKGRPKLVVMTLDSPRFQLSADLFRYVGQIKWNAELKLAPKLPKLLCECYDKALKNLESEAKKRKKSLYLETGYTGLIPDEVCARIQEAKQYFGDNIFIIAEAKNWSLTVEEPRTLSNPSDGDPIAVGFDGNALWIIDIFDLSSIERFAVSEFNF